VDDEDAELGRGEGFELFRGERGLKGLDVLGELANGVAMVAKETRRS
jgi:hypothetical protein